MNKRMKNKKLKKEEKKNADTPCRSTFPASSHTLCRLRTSLDSDDRCSMRYRRTQAVILDNRKAAGCRKRTDRLRTVSATDLGSLQWTDPVWQQAIHTIINNIITNHNSFFNITSSNVKPWSQSLSHEFKAEAKLRDTWFSSMVIYTFPIERVPLLLLQQLLDIWTDFSNYFTVALVDEVWTKMD